MSNCNTLAQDRATFFTKKGKFNQKVADNYTRQAISGAAPDAEIEVYADMLRVKMPSDGEQQGGGLRDVCKGFSEGSRRRLIQRMAQWNLNGLYTSFITLTYPEKYTDDWHIWKRDLETFVKRVERKYPQLVGAAWRVEFQKRGAPHFHLIIATSEPVCSCKSAERRMIKGEWRWVHKPHCKIALFRAEMACMWPDIVREGFAMGGGDMTAYSVHYERNKRVGTGVESVQDRRQLMAYVAKYISKPDSIKDEKTGKRIYLANIPDAWGRSWGFRNINGELDFSPVEIITFDYKQASALKRLVRRWLHSRGKRKYARMLGVRNGISYSVLGLGVDSENGRAAYKMLGGASKGLFASHKTPGGGGPAPGAVSFIERVAAGLVTVNRPGLSIGSRITTPAGLGVVSNMVHCPILKRVRVAVHLDEWQANNTKFAAFDLWQVRPVVVPQIRQEALL